MKQQKMEAVGFRKYGSADVLECIELPMPAIKPDEVLVRVAAAGVNPADWRIRRGDFKWFGRQKMPFVPGNDIAGTVVARGSQVKAFNIGDAVFAMTTIQAGGGYASYARVPWMAVAHMPRNLSFTQAAAVPLAGLTAMQALTHEVSISHGQRVLIYGASGGVGTFAVQIAKTLGAHVTGVCSTRNLAFVRSLGADQVLDYTQKDATIGEAQYHVIFDTVGKVPFQKWRKVLASTGTIVSVTPTDGLLPQFIVRLMGIHRLRSFLVQPNGARLAKLSSMIEAGKVKPCIDQTFDWQQAADAQRYSETGRARGKIVLNIHSAQADVLI